MSIKNLCLMDKENIIFHLANNFLNKFSEQTMNFLNWLNCFEYLLDIFEMWDIDKEKILLNMVNSIILIRIQKKLYPNNPFDLSYDQLISEFEHMFAHFHGEKAAYYRLMVRNQLPNEPAEHYAMALRKLLNKCPVYVQNTTDMKIRFISGLEDDEIRTSLKNYEKITFAMAVVLAKEMELDKKKKQSRKSCITSEII